MATTICETLGTVTPEGALELDQRMTVSPGRVKVRVESLEPLAQPKESLVEFVRRSRRELEAAGHKFMNDQEVTAWIEEMRSDDERIEEIYRQAEEEKRRGNAAP